MFHQIQPAAKFHWMLRWILTLFALLALPQSAGAQGQPCASNGISHTRYLGASAQTSTMNLLFTAPGCSWSVSVDASWVSVQGPSSGVATTTSVTVAFTMGTNTTASPRLANFTVRINQEQSTVDVLQNSTACTYSISPGSATVPVTGGSGTFALTPNPSTCWNAWVSFPTWLQISDPSASGARSVSYTVAPNSGAPRSSPIQVQSDPVSSAQFVVNQAGSVTAVSVDTNPSGLLVVVDGVTLTAPQTFSWTPGSTHTIGVPSPQGAGSSRAVYGAWSDSGAQTHTITVPAAAALYVAGFKTQFLLTTVVSPPGGGTITASPASPDGYYDRGTTVQLTASPEPQFAGWSGDLSGLVNPQSLTMIAARSVTALFGSAVTVTTNPPGLQLIVDGVTLTAPQSFTWTPGTSHTLAVNSPQGAGASRSIFASWSDGGAQSHTVTALSTAGSFTANFKTQYLLSMSVSPAGGGTITATPAATDGYYDSDVLVQLAAVPAERFVQWTGDLTGNGNPQSLRMTGARAVTANFGLPYTVTTTPPGLQVTVDGVTLTAPQSLVWVPASRHTLAVPSPQSASGTLALFASWSDGGTQAHTITAPTETATYTAVFQVRYLLTLLVSPPGSGAITASPASEDGYYDAGASVRVTASPASQFSLWSGDLSGTVNPQFIQMTAPRTATANFGGAVTVTSNPPGMQVVVDGTTFSAPQTFSWTPGSNHTISVNSPQGSGSTRYRFSTWSDGGAQSHAITAPADATVITVNFASQHLLSATVSPLGSGAIAIVPESPDGYYDAGTTVQLTAAPVAQFAGWSGDLSGTANPGTLAMGAPRAVTASFSVPPIPSFGITVSAQPATITDQPAATLRLDQPYPAVLTARFTLGFAPDAAGLPAGSYASSALQFVTGGRSATVTLPANAMTAAIPAIQIGDVAGIITLGLTEVQASGASEPLVLAGPPPTVSIRVPRLPPVLLAGAVRLTSVTATSLTVEITAASTPRDLMSAAISFQPAAGAQLGGSSFTIQLAGAAEAWFASGAGQASGGSFRLNVPFPYTGDPAAIASVSVTLTNSQGTSASVSGGR